MQRFDYFKSIYHDHSKVAGGQWSPADLGNYKCKVAGDHLFIYLFSFLPTYTLSGFYVTPPNSPYHSLPDYNIVEFFAASSNFFSVNAEIQFFCDFF